MGQMLERIVYVSRAAPQTDLPQVCSVIRAAYGRNAGDDVTGALLFLDGWFAQALEGPPAAIAAAVARIAGDPRHHAVDMRLRERALCRLFPDQPMALRTRQALRPELTAAFGYVPGFPVAVFPAADLVEFMVASCRQHVLGPRAYA